MSDIESILVAFSPLIVGTVGRHGHESLPMWPLDSSGTLIHKHPSALIQ